MQQEYRFRVRDAEQRRFLVSAENPDCPLNKFIGNDQVVRRIRRAAFHALGKNNRDCSDYSFAIFGPPSTGKTYLAKLFAEFLEIPFIVIEPQSINKTQDIFDAVEFELKNTDIKLQPVAPNVYKFPPMIIFIDEVHNLKNNIVQGLLKATEPKDRLLVTEKGIEVKTNHVCWMIATTDRGDLFDAFDTRFQKLELQLYSKKQMSKIIQSNNSDWSDDVCGLVAKYNSHVPREAIAFAKDMRIEKEMNGGNWADVAKRVAKDHDIDEYGMTLKRLEVLKALGQSTVSSSQMCYVVHVKEDELKKFIMPPLLARTIDQPVPLVTMSSRGYSITQMGLEELNKRGIKNRGLKAIPPQTRDIFNFVA